MCFTYVRAWSGGWDFGQDLEVAREDPATWKFDDFPMNTWKFVDFSKGFPWISQVLIWSSQHPLLLQEETCMVQDMIFRLHVSSQGLQRCRSSNVNREVLAGLAGLTRGWSLPPNHTKNMWTRNQYVLLRMDILYYVILYYIILYILYYVIYYILYIVYYIYYIIYYILYIIYSILYMIYYIICNI